MSDDLDQIRARQDEFDSRQAGFDTRLARLEEKVETEATLRAAMDHDIADIKTEQRAQRGMLQAVGLTLSDHTRRLTSIEGRLGGVEGRLGGVAGRLDNVEGRLIGVEGQLSSVNGRLGHVETELEEVKGKLGTVLIGVQAIVAMLERTDEASLRRRVMRTWRRGQR